MWREQWQSVWERGARLPWGVLAPLALAGIAGALAYSAAQNHLAQSERRVAERYATAHAVRAVIVAAKPLPAGAQLDASVLARRTMPVRYLPRTAYGPESVEGLYGRRLARPLEPGEALTPTALADQRSEALSAQFEPGERALTIAVDDTNSHANLVRPGDRIDLLWVTDLGDGDGGPAARPLLEAVQVLATGKTLRPAPDRGAPGVEGDAALREYTTLTLRVAPDAAARIALAERLGELLITLRAAHDAEVGVTGAMTVAAMLGRPARSVRGAGAERPQISGWVGGRGSSATAHAWPVGLAGLQVRP
jgi:pilus assembly protein CpaB